MKSAHSSSHVAPLLEPIVAALDADAVERLIAVRADPIAQRPIDTLAQRSNAGQMSDDERRECEAYIRAIDFIALLQGLARTRLRREKPLTHAGGRIRGGGAPSPAEIPSAIAGVVV